MTESNMSAPTPPSAPITPSDLVERGFALFPLRPDSKVPAVARDWERAATTSLARLGQLSAAYPRANHGIACGPSNLVVLDLDVAKEVAEPGEPTEGRVVLRRLAAGRPLPRTFTVRTPSGGLHLYFRPPVDGPAPRNTVRRLGPLIDTRGAGGYVVAPGSRIGDAVYEVIDDAPIAELPEWISLLLRPLESRPALGEPLPLATALGSLRTRLSGAYARSALEREIARVESARIGTRNDTLNRAAYNLGTLVGSGLLDRVQAELELTRAARAAGLDARETASTLRSGLNAGIARPRRLVGPAAALGVGSVGSVGAVSAVGAAAAGSAAESAASTSGATAVAAALRSGAASSALIPTSIPHTAEWPRAFGRFQRLGLAATALWHDLRGGEPGTMLPRPGRDPSLTVGDVVKLLARLDESYDTAARTSGPIAGSWRWQRILALTDALRDLAEELDEARVIGDVGEDGMSLQAFTLVRALTTAAARRISGLALELADRLGNEGRRRSPLWTALRQLHRDAEAMAAAGQGPSSLAASRALSSRSALQEQLQAMRRGVAKGTLT